jgi:hypothetical protein
VTLKIESGVPVPSEHPSRNLFKRLNIYLPWDRLVKSGDSFFIQGGVAEDRQALWMAASRKGIKVRTEVRVEEAGSGVRVWRV